MRLAFVSIAGLFSTFAVGCFSARSSAPDSFVCQTIRNTVQSPIRDFDEVRFIKRTRHEAEKAWDQYRETSGLCFADPYHKGFVEGFVDYVQAGGNGEPPYLPPFRYRLTPFRSSEGVSAVEDWYAGFRQGVAIAKGSGLRELSYIPLPGPAVPVDPSVQNIGKLPPTNPSQTPEGSPWDQPRTIPMPQPTPPNNDPPRIAPPPRPGFFPQDDSKPPTQPLKTSALPVFVSPQQQMAQPHAPELPPLPLVPSVAVAPPQQMGVPHAPELPPLPLVPSVAMVSQPLNSVSPRTQVPPQVSEIRQVSDTTPLVAVPRPVLPPPQVTESSAVRSSDPSNGAGPN